LLAFPIGFLRGLAKRSKRRAGLALGMLNKYEHLLAYRFSKSL
jgi:hypothetical protein